MKPFFIFPMLILASAVHSDLVKISIRACSDNGHKNGKPCDLMIDENTSQEDCFVSNPRNPEVDLELQLEGDSEYQKYEVHKVRLLSRSKGDKFVGTQVNVCENEADESCVYCSEVTKMAKKGYTSLKCENIIEGTRIQLIGDKDGMAICDVAVKGKQISSTCVVPGSLGFCEMCAEDVECGEGRICDPVMKKCVKTIQSEVSQCYITKTRDDYPDCWKGKIGPHGKCFIDPTECDCRNKKFPQEWVKCNNGSSGYAYYEPKEFNY